MERIAFSLSVRDLDRHAQHLGLSPALLHRLQQARLLAVRGDRVSFGHELFLKAFAAEAVVRRAGNVTKVTLDALTAPRYAEARALIVGAIDDESLLASVIEQASDASLLQDCFFGQCGVLARSWVDRRCADVLRKVRTEVEQVAFAVNEEELNGVGVVQDTLLDWSDQERALLPVIAAAFAAGQFVEAIMDTAAALDRRLDQEFARLSAVARQKKIALRSGIFSSCYTQIGGDITFRTVSTTLQTGGI